MAVLNENEAISISGENNASKIIDYDERIDACWMHAGCFDYGLVELE